MRRLPDEIEELKNRLRLELDGQGVRWPYIEIALLCVNDWYAEYQEDYEKIIDSSAPPEKDAEYWRNWALQNIS